MNNQIVEMVFGSRMYGLETPDSDYDYKGIYIPHPKDILLGKAASSISHSTGNSGSRNKPTDVDSEFYSLKKFVELALAGDTVAIDMLHCPNDKLITTSPVWAYLVANRHRFYTTELTGLFGYVRKQAAKYGVKGSRLAALRQVVDALTRVNRFLPLLNPSK